jgi:multiple sugar transport system permease protein
MPTMNIRWPKSSSWRWPSGWLFASPWLVGFVLLVGWPFAASLYWSFCRYDLLTTPRWVGGANYRRLAEELLAGERFGQAVWNTLYFALLAVPLSVVLGVGLAVALSWRVRGQAVYRTLVFLPSVVPVVAASVLWMWLLDPQDGLVNHLLGMLGIAPQGWFNSVQEAAWPASWLSGWNSSGVADSGSGVPGWGFGSKDGLVLMHLWGVGNFMIIYLAALGDVPVHLYEAAELDGAGRWRRFVHVTLPMLSPVIFFNLVMGLIQSVQAFTQVYIVSEGQGAPAGSTMMLSLHLFLAAFKDLDMGYASAMAWVLFVVIALTTLAMFRTARGWVYYQGAAR